MNLNPDTIDLLQGLIKSKKDEISKPISDNKERYRLWFEITECEFLLKNPTIKGLSQSYFVLTCMSKWFYEQRNQSQDVSQHWQNLRRDYLLATTVSNVHKAIGQEITKNPHIDFVYNDGGRKAAGYKGVCGDCVIRAICIVTNRPYKDVYRECAELNSKCRIAPKRMKGKRSARSGVITNSEAFIEYMKSMGFVWTATMAVGRGCKVHLRRDELPKGRIICAVSRHWCAVIDGVLTDSFDCSRNGRRCVYGYWTYQPKPA